MLRHPSRWQWVISTLLILAETVSARNYTFGELFPCTLNTLELSQLGPNDHIEPCIIFDVSPNDFTAMEVNKSATITMVHVTPSGCGNHRDGAVTGVQSLNNDNGGKGIALGFSENFYVSFRLVSVVAGNPASLPTDEYNRRHVQILKSMITTLDAPYIIGTCSFAAAIEKEPAKQHQAIVMSQVGPPGFYTDENPWVFGFHINSDDYPLPAVQSLGFLAAETEEGPPGIPVRVIYRTKSEFFYSTCRSAIDKLKSTGFTDIKEILYDHSADHDGDGDINQFDEDFLISLADEACPPGSGDADGFHPALFACTLTEQNVILQRWMENGCRPVSLWVTAATWNWATDNLDVVPYYQGGGQWHEAFDYSDKYFDSGKDLLLHNQGRFGYLGVYDQVVAYAIPVLFAQHLQASYRVEDHPDPIGDFHDEERREYLRRDMIVLNVPTLFGPVAFNDFQRNIGRSAAGSQWLPLKADGSIRNALVSPFLQAEAGTVVPSPSALPCDAGFFANETLRVQAGSLLAAACAKCPVDTFTVVSSQAKECKPCPEGSSTEGLDGQDVCIVREDNLIPSGILAFGYVASCASYILSFSFILWLIYFREDPVVRVSQLEFLLLICMGTLLSTSTVIALSFQAGSDEDTSAASAGCAAAPFLYAIGWVLQYSSLSAKTFRLYIIMRNNNQMKRVAVSACQMFRIVVGALIVDFAILVSWVIVSPLEYVRTEESTDFDKENGIITISTVGRCVSSSDDAGFWAFAAPLVAFHVILVVGTNALLYQVREVGDRYQEQKYVGMASMLMCEILIVGIPVVVSVQENPTALFIVLTGIVALDDIGILCCIFVPKIIFQRKGLEEGVNYSESIMRESHKRASTREYARRESSFMVSQGPEPSLVEDDVEVRVNKRDSFTARISGNNIKSPFGKKLEPAFGNSASLADSMISESILEETSEDLKHFESDGDSSSARSGNRAAQNVSMPLSESTRNLRAKKRSLESQLSNGRINQSDGDPLSPKRTSSGSETSSNVEQSERMLAATKKLMEEHERMMKATALIMSEHERLKQRLEEAQGWKLEAETKTSNNDGEMKPSPAATMQLGSTHEEMKQRLLASKNWTTGSQRFVADASSEGGITPAKTGSPEEAATPAIVHGDEDPQTGQKAIHGADPDSVPEEQIAINAIESDIDAELAHEKADDKQNLNDTELQSEATTDTEDESDSNRPRADQMALGEDQ